MLDIDDDFKIDRVGPSAASIYKEFLDSKKLSDATKYSEWQCVNVFLKEMSGFNGMHLKNPFTINPYKEYRRYAYKYIPDDVLEQLDRVFKDEEIELKFRVVYWVLRLIPSRISEVLGMKLDCLKHFNEHYQLFVPTWKQNGGNKEPILRTIRLEKTGIAGYLIDLIKRKSTFELSIFV